MEFKLSHVLEGIKNSVFVKEEVEKVAAERHSICSQCNRNSKNTGKNYTRPDEFCTVCSCNLYLKTRSMSASCPESKWPALATPEESELIDEAINNDNQDKQS